MYITWFPFSLKGGHGNLNTFAFEAIPFSLNINLLYY